MTVLPSNPGLIREIALLFLERQAVHNTPYVIGADGGLKRSALRFDFANPEHAANRCGISFEFAKLYDNVQVVTCHARMYKLPGLAHYWRRAERLNFSFPHYVCLIDGEWVLDLTHRQVDRHGPHPGIFRAEDYLADWDGVYIKNKDCTQPDDVLPSFRDFVVIPRPATDKDSYHRPFDDSKLYAAREIIAKLEISRSEFDLYLTKGDPNAGAFPAFLTIRKRAKLWGGKELSDWVVEKRFHDERRRIEELNRLK